VFRKGGVNATLHVPFRNYGDQFPSGGRSCFCFPRQGTGSPGKVMLPAEALQPDSGLGSEKGFPDPDQ